MCAPDVAVAAGATNAPPKPLFPEERAAIARAIDKRRAEFTAGRMAARAALADLGCPPVAIPMAKDRAPIWPAGFTGSISHSNEIAVAIAATFSAPGLGGFDGLGVDIEKATLLEPNLWPTILRQSERDWLMTQPAHTRGLLAKQLFSIKECVYKAQYPTSKTVLGFSAFTVALDPTGHFSATFQIPCPPFAKGDKLQGQSRISGGMILSTTRL